MHVSLAGSLHTSVHKQLGDLSCCMLRAIVTLPSRQRVVDKSTPAPRSAGICSAEPIVGICRCECQSARADEIQRGGTGDQSQRNTYTNKWRRGHRIAKPYGKELTSRSRREWQICARPARASMLRPHSLCSCTSVCMHDRMMIRGQQTVYLTRSTML